MGSTLNGLELNGAAASPITEGSLKLKLTGIRIDSERDPRGPYKPSRMLDLTVDNKPVSFPSRERISPWTCNWEIESKSSVPITTESTIMVQPYAARRFKQRKKAEHVTILGDLVLRLFLASAKPGDTYHYEHVGEGFKVFLSFVAQKDTQATTMNGSDPGGPIDVPGMNFQEVSPDPSKTPDQLQSCLHSLKDLMQSLPSSASELRETGEKAIETLQKACSLVSTGRLENDVGHLCDQVYKLLRYMQEPVFSGNLVSLSKTVKSTLILIRSAAMFLEDYLSHKSNDLAKPASRKPILDEFDGQLMLMENSLDIGKDVSVSERRLPYTRKLTLSPTASHFTSFPYPFGGGSRFETTNQGRDGGTSGTDLDKLLGRALQIQPESIPTNSTDLACVERTRFNLLSEITAWFDDNSAPNILWLCGAPGTGKTTISWSLIEELKRQQRCAGFFFFRPGEHTPSKLWRTLAFEMARFHPAIQSEIHSIVTNRTDKPNIYDVEVTFSKLVSGPLKTANSIPSGCGPVLLIDALDQCRRSQDNSWKILLDTLLQWSSLPRHCKLIITSRPQSDIVKAFESEKIHRMDLLSGDSVDRMTQRDVIIYLNYRFAKMRQDKSISDRFPNIYATSKLVDHTKGNFKWAAVAVDSIRDAEDKEKQLTAIIEGGTMTKLDHFDSYLEEVLKMAFEFDVFERNSPDTHGENSSDSTKGHASDVFRETMMAIALSKQPLTMDDLKYFLHDHFASASGASIEDVCHRLLPIISIDGEIKIRHNAYKDYLVDSKRCKLISDAFHGNVHRKMTIQCLKIMQQELKFNICGLKSSYRMNGQVEDKDSLIKNCIPSNLAYACQYWADHLRGITAVEKRDAEIVKSLRTFLNTQLLFWLEVLSMLSTSHVAPKSLLVAAEWLEVSPFALTPYRRFMHYRYYRRIVADDLSSIAADASRFSFTFADVISTSAPHIYLSALPFAPASSSVSKLYRERFPQTIKVLRKEGLKWPAMRYSISTGACVYDISIHPDGKRVAAAMSSGAMIFSMTTGESLSSLLGHGASVHTIAYSPGGKNIATGCDDGRLRIYEAENGSLLVGPFNLHLRWIRSVAWSPDGQRIVTGSGDRKVKVVAAETGEVIYDTAFHSNWVRTVLFTTEFFISCSNDRTVRIYNASTGTASGEAWSTGQADYIGAIAISPDGKILAAGSDDHSIILYDMNARKMISTPIMGHDGAIRCLVFSRDGQRLASCSDDKTVRLWNVSTRKMFCDPLYGNTSRVSSVKFSPDMKQLVTGGEDGSIRFFDMDSLPIQNYSRDTGVFRAAILLDDGNTVLASDGSSISKWTVDKGCIENVPFESDSGHLDKVQSVTISPDGKLVATATGNRTIVIWNAESGKISCGPIEGLTHDIHGLGFSPDSTMIVSGSDDKIVSIWSVATGEKFQGPMEGHDAGVGEVCFSPDGKQVASGSYDNTAILWSVTNGDKVYGKAFTLTLHKDSICGLAYSPDGHYLATASDDHTVAIWNVATGKREFVVLKGHHVRVVNWSSDSKWIVTGALDNTIRVFNVETGSLVCKPLTGHANIPTMLTFRSSSLHHDVDVVSASLDGTIRVWELGTKSFAETRTITKHHEDWIMSVSISPVQNRIASGGHDGRLFVTDSATGDVKVFRDAYKCWIRCVTHSPDGTMIATCSNDSTISIWDAGNGNCLSGTSDCDVGAVLSIAFSPDGMFLISGNNDTTVRSWALNTPTFGQLSALLTYRGHTGPVRTVAYAHKGDSMRIVSGSDDKEIAIWDENGSRIRTICGHEAAILSICVSGDKVFSSSRDKTIRVSDLNTGENISIICGHTAPINAIKLSPDEHWVVSASDDGSLRIWDSQTYRPLTLPQCMPFRILSVDVSRDGNLIACSGADSQVHTWCPDMVQPAVWPDNFMRKMHGEEYCPIDDQGILVDATLRKVSGKDGWLCGPMGQVMCWIPPEHRQGLLQRVVNVVGVKETALDLRGVAHGTKWEECAASN